MTTPPPKEKFSAWSIFYSVIFVVLLILLGERAWSDLDKFFNPLYSICHEQIVVRHLVDVVAVGPGCDAEVYEASRLVFHIALIVPLLFIQQLIYYSTGSKRLEPHRVLIVRSYFLFLLWLTLHLFVEITLLLFRYYSDFGFYVIVGFLAVVFALLVVLVQRRYNEKQLTKRAKQ